MNTVAIKMLPFWPSDPEVWLAQVNAQFMVKNITSQDTKFAHVVAVLSPEAATEVRDLILNHRATNPFDVLKDTLNERVSLLKRQKIQAKQRSKRNDKPGHQWRCMWPGLLQATCCMEPIDIQTHGFSIIQQLRSVFSSQLDRTSNNDEKAFP